MADVAPAAGTFRRDEASKSTVTNIELHCDLLSHIRDAASTPSTVAELLLDPVIMSSFGSSAGKKKSKTRRGSSSSHREPHTPSPTTMVRSMVLAEEERQTNHLKAVLKTTGDRLEREIQRADRDEKRADHAEIRTREIGSRVSAAEAARHASELDSTRLKEEMRLFQLQIDSLQRDLRRAQDDVRLLEKRRVEAEENAAKSRDGARKFQIALTDLQARDSGREDARRMEIQKWYDVGRQEGWDAGREEGFEEGKNVGFKEGKLAGLEEGRRAGRDRGWDEGVQQGRKAERHQALKAFDKFLAEEIHGQRDDESDDQADQADRIQRWARSAYLETRSASGGSPGSWPVQPQHQSQAGDSVVDEEYDVI